MTHSSKTDSKETRPVGIGYLASREHLSLLKQGVALWNDLRKQGEHSKTGGCPVE